MLLGLLVLVVSLLDKEPGWIDKAIGAAIFLFGALFALGLRPKKVTLGGTSIEIEEAYFERTTTLVEQVKQKKLDQELLDERASYAESKTLPGPAAPEYSAVQLAKINELLVRPSAYPLTPMYLLDSDYRILDWNEAFSLAFDRTMEGRQGRSVLEWTYHLDNYQEVLDHGELTFKDPNKLPLIDVEKIVYTSLRYGRIEAKKRAYRIPDDDGLCLAWLITMDLDFANRKEKSRYRYELLRLIGLEQLWSEYAISYDRVLTSTRVYWDLIDALLGVKGSLEKIPKDAKVLDLGAGTGNISNRLMEGDSQRIVFALDNNRVMLDFLRDKCADFLRSDDQGPGILMVKQDVTSLFGIPDDYFDFVIANNVFYVLADPEASLEAVFRVLKPGGELRMSGPRRDTNLNELFQEIRSDLENAGRFREYKMDYEHVEQINKLRLKTMLHKWTTEDFLSLLRRFEFEVTHSSEEIYAGQSMLVTARRPEETPTQPIFEAVRRA